MSVRRRNGLILALVALLLGGAFYAIFTQPTRLGLDLKGGVSLVYEVQGTEGRVPTDEQIQRTIDVITQRVNQLGTTEAEIQRSGERQIDVSLPEVTNARQAEETVGTTAQLAFYNWEQTVVGPSGRPEPENPEVAGSGGQAGSQSAGISKIDAVQRAAKLQRQPRGALVGDQWFAVDRSRQEVIGPPETTRDRLLRAVEEDRGDYRAARAPDGGLREGVRAVRVPAGYRIVQAESRSASADPDSWFVVRDRPILTGDNIRNPEVGQGDRGQGPSVNFQFDERGRNVWRGVTRDIAQFGQDRFLPQAGVPPRQQVSSAAGHFAIVLDDRLISVPQIDFVEFPDGIDVRNGSSIVGNFTQQSATQLARLLETGSLPVRLDLISQSQVSATLGAESLNQALIAGVAGFVIVALFLIAFYRVLGVIAVGALVAYAIFVAALVNLIPIVMTLPGIAGLILTLGVAADSNIIVFERVKEEIRQGRSVPRAISEGFRKGLSAIVDGNVVTFLTAFILFLLTQANVRGFALTLGVGTIVAFLTAVILTQAVLAMVARSRLMSHPAAFGAKPGGKQPPWFRFDFVGWSRWFFAMSGVILIVGAAAIGVNGIPLSIDFESGTRITATVQQGTTESDIRGVLARSGFGDARIQEINEGQGQATFQISTPDLEPPQLAQVRDGLQRGVGLVPNGFSNDTIGPTFGATVARSAILAMIFSLLVTGVVIWLRFGARYTVPILVALLHDALLVAGIYSLAGREVTAASVAALLTIVGYSLYDTIIVFDRVRENVKKMPSAAYRQIANRSMAEVLMRSLATSVSTALPVLALMVFGGETLRDFAFALLIGTISGAYSSVFIAGQVLTFWFERDRKWAFRAARVAHANGGVVPAYAHWGRTVEAGGGGGSATRGRAGLPDDDPTQGVGREEFDRMVDELGLEDHPTRAPDERPVTPRGGRGRRARDAPADGGATAPETPESATAPGDRAADLAPEDLVLEDDRDRQKRRKPRNRGHGRPR